MINNFRGEYAFLSNFFYGPFRCSFKLLPLLPNYMFPTVEHYFQATKSSTVEGFEKILKAGTPGSAKHMGRRVDMIPNWDQWKEQVMLEGVWAKFTQNPSLQQQLLSTIGHELVEGNYWGDKYWGICLRTNEGQNRLGVILMHVRNMLDKQRKEGAL